MSVAVTAPEPEVATELVALRVLSTAIRCREVGGGLVTYRKSSPEVVPGERLTVRAERRWGFLPLVQRFLAEPASDSFRRRFPPSRG